MHCDSHIAHTPRWRSNRCFQLQLSCMRIFGKKNNNNNQVSIWRLNFVWVLLVCLLFFFRGLPQQLPWIIQQSTEQKGKSFTQQLTAQSGKCKVLSRLAGSWVKSVCRLFVCFLLRFISFKKIQKTRHRAKCVNFCYDKIINMNSSMWHTGAWSFCTEISNFESRFVFCLQIFVKLFSQIFTQNTVAQIALISGLPSPLVRLIYSEISIKIAAPIIFRGWVGNIVKHFLAWLISALRGDWS